MVEKSALDKLREFDSATVANVIELFKVRPRNRGFMTREIVAAFPELPPMIGFASTATCRTFAELPERAVPAVPDLISRFDELSGPPVIVLQNLDTGGQAANFGDVFCNSFKAFGAAGLVTNGPGRDFVGIEPLNFPVFYNGIVCAHGYMHMLDLHVPVQVGGIDVYPDDLLHGDANGVTTIPREIAADAADACAEYAAAEAVVISTAQSGSATLTQLRDAYGEMKTRIADLSARVCSS